jgi:hypothetical protein
MMSDIIYLDSYVNQVLTKIYGSQNLCKYLYYDVSNPLDYPTISDTKELFDDIDNKRIYTTPFNLDVLNIQKTSLTINFLDSNLDNGNIFYKDIKLKFAILIPYHLWELSAESGVSNTRISGILHELLELFNRKSTVGIGSNLFTRVSGLYPNQQVGGIILEMWGKDFIVNH